MLTAIDVVGRWPLLPVGAILLLCLLYLPNMWRLLRRDSKALGPIGQTRLRLLAFGVAVGALVAVLLTPVDSIARTQLFMMHMVQVVTITTISAPLLLLAAPAALLQPLVEGRYRRRLLRFLTHPLVASLLFNGLFLFWHIPVIFAVPAQTPPLYHLALLSLLAVSLLNWWPLIGPLADLRRLSYPAQMLYAFLDGQPVDIFAFLLIFAGTVFYPHYALPAALGLSPLNDQEAAGAMLLLPGLIDLVVMTPLFFRWLATLEEQARLRDRQLQQLLEAEQAAARGAPSGEER
jgi:putative membrane protein